MGYELVGTPKTEKVTQSLAIKFRDMDPVPHDRPLNPKRVEAYRKMLDAGLFRPVSGRRQQGTRQALSLHAKCS